jgi:hypothetical protein
MAEDVMRPAKAYRLWDSADRDELCDSHAQVGWVCQVETVSVNGGLSRTVLLQNNTTKQAIKATRDKVIVSDLTNVEALSVTDYNQLYPNSQIQPPEGAI